MKIVIFASALLIASAANAAEGPYVEVKGVCPAVECALPTPEAAKDLARVRMENNADDECTMRGYTGVDHEITSSCRAYANIDGFDAECFGAFWCKE